MNSATEIDARSVVDYLRSREVLSVNERAEAHELGGGVSNIVLLVSTSERDLIVKQSLPRLRVAEEWLFDQGRIRNEHLCMSYLGTFVPDAVPTVVDRDDAQFTFTMTAVPSGGTLWKDDLLGGNVDMLAAQRAGALLATVHTTSSGDARASELFGDSRVLLEGRIDPYHRAAALCHPDLGRRIEDEIQRMLAVRESLVLGDFSPKNTFVYPDRLIIIDFEVAHIGDPAFDIAFLVALLTCKAVWARDRASDYLAAAQCVWTSYAAALTNTDPAGLTLDRISRASAAELGCILLARADGKSPAEYLDTSARASVRAFGRALILQDDATLPEALADIEHAIRGRSRSAL